MNGADDTRPYGLRLNLGRLDPTSGRPVRWAIPTTWAPLEPQPEAVQDATRPLAALVSFHYLRAAVRRRWPIVAAAAVLGALLAASYLVVSPTMPMATTTLLLSHDDRLDPARAMSTDVGLLTTRTVAQRTVASLGLAMAPEDLLESVEPVPSDSSEVLQLTMTAPTREEATRWLDVYVKEYLTFRAQQIFAQSDLVTKDYQTRVDALKAQVRTASTRIEGLAAGGDTATDRLSDAITERSQLNNQISQLQAEVETANLRKNAIVGASRVIDPPAAVRTRGLRRAALVLTSGLIGSLGVALLGVALAAILSDRLRLRIEVASALEAPVPLSVGRLSPMRAPARFVAPLLGLRRVIVRRSIDQQRAARVIMNALPASEGRRSLVLLCLGNARQVRFAVVAAAMALQQDGQEVTIVDLTQDAEIRAAAGIMGIPESEVPRVLRPEFVPSVAESPFALGQRNWDKLEAATARQGVNLVLAELDPAVGADHLKAWADDVLVAVTAGRSSVELVRTAGDLVRAAGLHLGCAILLGAERDDTSSGMAPGAPLRQPGLPTGALAAGQPTPLSPQQAGPRGPSAVRPFAP